MNANKEKINIVKSFFLFMLLAILLTTQAISPAMTLQAADQQLKYQPSGKKKKIAYKKTEVGKHGKLSLKKVKGYTAPTIVDKNGKPYQLRGLSTQGLSWGDDAKYINKEAFQTFRDYWGANVIRIAVYAREGEHAYIEKYAKQWSEQHGGNYQQGTCASYNDKLIQEGVKAASELGMYVIIDWHVLNYNPNEDRKEATAFFKKYAKKYKNHKNVLFEICNEPVGTPWYDGSGNDLYTYGTKLTKVIRKCGSKALVICGTNSWSSRVDEVAGHKLKDSNTLYACHFYAASHYDWERSLLTNALDAGVPVFVSEFGVCDASGSGNYDFDNADTWLDLCDKNNVSYACWAISNLEESAAYFQTGLQKFEGGWKKEELKPTGVYLVNRYRDAERNRNIQEN